MRKLLLLCCLAFSISSVYAQHTGGLQNIGLSTQLYPAGTIIQAQASWPLSEKSLFVAKLGYNLAERQDFGEHDQEDGGGPGITAGYKQY